MDYGGEELTMDVLEGKIVLMVYNSMYVHLSSI